MTEITILSHYIKFYTDHYIKMFFILRIFSIKIHPMNYDHAPTLALVNNSSVLTLATQSCKLRVLDNIFKYVLFSMTI